MNQTAYRNRNKQYSIICGICAFIGIYGIWTQDIRAIQAAAIIVIACILDSGRDA